MIWKWYGQNHGMAISSWMRAWLRGPFTDRFFLLVMSPWGSGWTFVSLSVYAFAESGFFFWVALLPWGFLFVDSAIDGRQVRSDLARLLAQPNVILATRAEYVGGHPELPHGRFVYLAIEGKRDSPNITILLPGDQYTEFPMPLLDFEGAEERSEKSESITASILATLSEKPSKLFQDERVVLNVKYTDTAGRKQNVELTSFFGGSSEVRNWRNYLVCAQAEGDTGVTPYGPWRSLQPAGATEETDDIGMDGLGAESGAGDWSGNGYSRNGARPGLSGTRNTGSAFRRR
jgi:hypothetical protein